MLQHAWIVLLGGSPVYTYKSGLFSVAEVDNERATLFVQQRDAANLIARSIKLRQEAGYDSGITQEEYRLLKVERL